MTSGPRHVSFGIKTSQMGLTYEEIQGSGVRPTRSRSSSTRGFGTTWCRCGGTSRGAALEAWTLLAALAAQTSRLRLGVMVTSNRLRSPTLLAKMAATVDIIAGGRLDFGIGAGGSRVAVENPAVREFEAYGVPLVSPGVAVRDLAESFSIIRRMWTEAEPFDFDGAVHRPQGCRMRAQAPPEAPSADLDRRLPATGSCASSPSTPTSGTTRGRPRRSSDRRTIASMIIALPSDATRTRSSARCRRSFATTTRPRSPRRAPSSLRWSATVSPISFLARRSPAAQRSGSPTRSSGPFLQSRARQNALVAPNSARTDLCHPERRFSTGSAPSPSSGLARILVQFMSHVPAPACLIGGTTNFGSR